MSQTTTVNGVRHVTTKGAISFSRLYAAEFQKEGTLTAEIRQTIVTDSYYPSKRTESSMQNGLFNADEFGFDSQHFQNVENRVAWILVPASVTEEAVKARIDVAAKAGACIYRVMSNEPILDENQQYAIGIGLRTKDDFANSQVVRYPKDHEQANQLVMTASGQVQYRRTFFWATPKDDVDMRDASKEAYTSPLILAEMGGVSAASAALIGQTLNLENGQPASGIPAGAKHVPANAAETVSV